MKLSRYAAYKDSGVEWIGNVPSHWEIGPLKRLLDLQNGADHKAIETDDGVPVIGSGGAFAFASMAMFDGESVLLGRKGTIDRPIYVNGPFWTVDTMYWSKVNPGVSAKFAYYSATTIPFGYYSTNTALPSMTKAALNAHAVACPSYEEQSAIAAFLDRETSKIDALIAEQERLLELLTEKRQSVISHAVTKGLNPHAPMKDSGVAWLGEVPAHWTVSPLKSLAKIGNGSTPNRDTPEYWAEEGFPWLNSSVVNQARVTESDQFVTQLALDQCHLPLIDPPAILVGITGQGKTRGMATALGFKATVSQHVAYVKPRGGTLLDSFLLRVFEAIYDRLRIESDGAGSTKGAITCEQIGNIRIPLPSIDEQAFISAQLASELATMDKLGLEAEKAIALLSERRSALIAAAVTGQIDVREAS
ncbi:MAG: restriction endonuclease subunit S [Rhizobiaceae bacterium]|nr:restriction endonuclease subunit S [Rhizobiaceae bacterium]